MRIKDLSNELWFITIPKLKFGFLKENEIIRIRSAKINITQKRNVIETGSGTNIMRFTFKNAIVKELQDKIEIDTEKDMLMLEDTSEVIMNPITFTEITDPELKKSPLFKLDDLFLNYDDIPIETRQKNLFRVRFYALRIDPQDHREAVQVMDPETKELFSCKDLKGANPGKSKKSGQECQFMYRIQLLVKDQISQLNKNFYRILLYSYDQSHGQDFFKQPAEACNLYLKENEDKLNALKLQLNNMVRFNVWCDAILERQNNFFIIRDTKIIAQVNNDDDDDDNE